jgi:hypothetical protein
MALGYLEPLAAAAVEDVQVDRTGTRSDLYNSPGCGMHPCRRGLVNLHHANIRPPGHRDHPVRALKHVPASGPMMVPTLDDDVPPLLVIVRTGGRTDVGRFDVYDPDGRLFLNVIE